MARMKGPGEWTQRGHGTSGQLCGRPGRFIVVPTSAQPTTPGARGRLATAGREAALDLK